MYGDHKRIKSAESYSQPDVLISFITDQFKIANNTIPFHILANRLDEYSRSYYLDAEGITREGARALLYIFGYLIKEI